MISTSITFVVHYDNPDQAVDGTTKSRFFATQHEAEVWISDDLPKLAPNHKNVSLTKISTRKERIF